MCDPTIADICPHPFGNLVSYSSLPYPAAMIETDRLILRPYTLVDYEPCCSMICDPTVVGVPAEEPMSREEAWHRVMRYAGHWSLLGYGIFAVLEKATGRYIGETGLADFHRGMGALFDGADEASWFFLAGSRGRGYAFEAAQAAHSWYTSKRRQRRTVCMISPENAASTALAIKIGYRRFGEGTYKGNRLVMLERLPM